MSCGRSLGAAACGRVWGEVGVGQARVLRRESHSKRWFRHSGGEGVCTYGAIARNLGFHS